MGNYKFYAVKNGHIPGIYSNWSEAEKQIKGFPNQKYKGFDDETDAINYLYGLENRYFGLKRIGSGGFAEVFRFQENNNDVAIKILKENTQKIKESLVDLRESMKSLMRYQI